MSEATAILSRNEEIENQGNPATDEAQKPAFVSWEVFQKDYLTREDGFKYEWLNGVVEQTPYFIEKIRPLIQGNLLLLFYKLLLNDKVEGGLVAEADLFFDSHHRRPDLCWLKDEQLNNLSDGGDEVPAFVIEVISSNDVMNKVVKKMNDYRAAKVQVVWHIFPHTKEVHIYTGPKLKKMIVCMEGDVCSAAPVLGDFSMDVANVFKKIEKK